MSVSAMPYFTGAQFQPGMMFPFAMPMVAGYSTCNPAAPVPIVSAGTTTRRPNFDEAVQLGRSQPIDKKRVVNRKLTEDPLLDHELRTTYHRINDLTKKNSAHSGPGKISLSLLIVDGFLHASRCLEGLLVDHEAAGTTSAETNSTPCAKCRSRDELFEKNDGGVPFVMQKEKRVTVSSLLPRVGDSDPELNRKSKARTVREKGVIGCMNSMMAMFSEDETKWNVLADYGGLVDRKDKTVDVRGLVALVSACFDKVTREQHGKHVSDQQLLPAQKAVANACGIHLHPLDWFEQMDGVISDHKMSELGKKVRLCK
jgi:hypothetical protein